MRADTRGMVIRFALLAALIAAALVVVRNEHVFQNAGLTGYCHRVATPAGQTGFWNECVPGKLTGRRGSRAAPASASATPQPPTSGAV